MRSPRRVTRSARALRGDSTQGTGHRRLLIVNSRSAPKTADGPRRDYEELRKAASASVLDWDEVERLPFGAWMLRRIGFCRIAGFVAFARRRQYDTFWCFTEVEGLVLAALFKLFGVRKNLFVISLNPISRPARVLLGRFHVWTHMSQILVQTDRMRRALELEIGVPSSKVSLHPYQVDAEYFSKPAATDLARAPVLTPLVVMIGREARDFDTFFAAVRDLPIRVHVAAHSAYAKPDRRNPWRGSVPNNVTVSQLTLSELRAKYSAARLAVLCLYDTEMDRGITAIQEAMAMSLPVVLSRTSGQTDVVVDRAWPSESNFAHTLGTGQCQLPPSGIYVRVGDANGLRSAIMSLVDDAVTAATLGRNGRRFVEEFLTVEAWTARCLQRLEDSEISNLRSTRSV